jgi:hypothetical protein
MSGASENLNSMHQFDAELTNQVFDYMRDRLSMPEVPLDFPGDPKVLAEVTLWIDNARRQFSIRCTEALRRSNLTDCSFR